MHGPFAGKPTKPWKGMHDALRGLDPKLDEALALVRGDPELNWISDPFAALVNAACHQQISFKGGAARYDRLVEGCGGRITPATLVKFGGVRWPGFSQGLQDALLLLADDVLSKKFRPSDLEGLRLGELEERLERPFFGPWTKKFFALYHLHDATVLLEGDVSLLNAIQDWYELPERPSLSKLREITAPWHPHTAAACWYIFKAAEKRAQKAAKKAAKAPKSSKKTGPATKSAKLAKGSRPKK